MILINIIGFITFSLCFSKHMMHDLFFKVQYKITGSFRTRKCSFCCLVPVCGWIYDCVYMPTEGGKYISTKIKCLNLNL